MKTLHRRECQVCGCRDVIHVYENKMAPLDGIDLTYSVGECCECGFSFAYELPDSATYKKYYNELSKYDTSSEPTEFDEMRFEAIAKLCLKLFEPDHIFVDIGCGEGTLLSKLKSKGFKNLFGVEPAPNAAAAAFRKFGIDTIGQGFFANADTVAPISSAHCICFSAVMEHMPNLRFDLENILSKLKLECKIIIEVPCIELFGSDTVEPYGEFSIEHINYFSRDTLSNLMESLGWSCVHSQYLDYPLFQTGSVTSIFEKTHSKNSIKNSLPKFTLKTYTESCAVRISAMLKKIPCGDFLIYGAGSHSARIFPLLTSTQSLAVSAVVDGNPNLTGKRLGAWEIQTPGLINTMPGVPILVSSFRSQNEIANALRNKYSNPLVLLYP